MFMGEVPVEQSCGLFRVIVLGFLPLSLCRPMCLALTELGSHLRPPITKEML